MNLHKHQLYLLEQHSESFKIWSAIIRINTEGKSLIMKLGPGLWLMGEGGELMFTFLSHDYTITNNFILYMFDTNPRHFMHETSVMFT